jgi:hypothetical protein
MKSAIRSVLAVLAGIVVLTALSFAIEAAVNPLLMRMFSLPNEAALNQNVAVKVVTFAYSALCVAAGGYVTAWIARRSPVQHGLVMGAVEVALAILAMMKFPDQAPRWAWLLGMLMTIPAAYCGALLRVNQLHAEPLDAAAQSR